MPFLRFTRDTRGYENTYLMHAFRIRGRSQPRVLYWFRTPPGVRVGRSPLDEDAIRTIEESNPELKFDWKRILQARPEPSTVESRHRAEGPRRRQRPSTRAQRAPNPVEQRPRGSGPARPPFDPGSGRPERRRGGQRPPVQPMAARSEAPPVAPLEPSEPVDVMPAEEAVEEQLLHTVAAEEEPGVSRESEPESDLEAEPVPRPTHALDPESHARLRARYAEILARVAERTSDPARQEELRAKAERLDPDSWVTADEVRQGLEHYEQVYDEVRRVLGRRRRRRRGRRRPAPPGTEGPPGGG
ncbi:MAG: hypothetical protein HYZ58_00795 [Acidobacteria bacterium]|nr:hypothetical protein [Acidobacteriota bacterium]